MMATVLGGVEIESAAWIMMPAYCGDGLSTPKMYGLFLAKIALAAPLPSTIGI